MRIESNETCVVIRNDLIELRAERETGELALTLSAARRGAGFIPVLERVGKNQETTPLRAEIPRDCELEVDSTVGPDGNPIAFLTVHGSVGEAAFWINFWIRQDSPWVEIHELLALDAQAETIAVDWLEAAWRFVDWQEPGQVFSPALVPEGGDVIGRHVMRSPALAAQCADRAAALVYSVDSIYRTQALPACMNLLRDQGTPVFRTGLRPHQVRDHVYYAYRPDAAHQARFHHAYHLYVAADAPAGAALDEANRRLWERYGSRFLKTAPPLPIPFDAYARQIYPRVFDQLWAETRLDGRRVGAVRTNRSYAGDVWMCAWFNQLRSAYGLYLWGKWLDNPEWVERALATRDLHLAAPQQEGLFPTVFVFGETPETCRWVHSHHQGGGPGIYHLFDMSWTVYQLLRWHRDLVQDERTLDFARRYGRGVLRLQSDDGSLPAYVDAKRLLPVDKVDREQLIADLESHPAGDPYVLWGTKDRWAAERFVHSAEDAASLLALAELARVLPDQDPERDLFVNAACRIAHWLERWVYPQGRWIDFEVYFSCSAKPLDFYDHRSGQWPQNTLCMHMAAAGFLALYELKKEARFLQLARRAMDRLSLYQQVWDPPFFNFYGFGGYGVMNTDGEWNDARQAQFADTHLDFYRVLGDPEHLERALAACRASFTTLFLPASSGVYPTGWCRQPRGLAAENHAHGGTDHLCGVSGFDWGSGSALATAAYFRLHLGSET
jgi:hypothetical protein